MAFIKSILLISYWAWVTTLLFAVCVMKLNGSYGWHNVVSIAAILFHMIESVKAIRKAWNK